MKQLIKHISATLPTSSQVLLKPYLIEAQKLSSSNEEEAYLLGTILKRAVALKQVSESEEKKVHEIIKRDYTFLEFYDRKRKPNFDDWSILSLIVCVFGGLGIIYGVLMLYSNQYFITFSTVTLTENIKGGGYLFILGLVMSIGGFIKTKQEYTRKRLLRHHG